MEDDERNTCVTELVTGFNTARNQRIAEKLRKWKQADATRAGLTLKVADRSISQRVTDDTWAFKVPALRAKLNEIGLSDRGKKPELCERLIQHRINKLSQITQDHTNNWLNDDIQLTDLMEEIEKDDEGEEDDMSGDDGNGEVEDVDEDEQNEVSWEPGVHPNEDARSTPIGLRLGTNSGADCLGVGDMRKKVAANPVVREDELRRIAAECETIRRKDHLRDELIYALLEAVESLAGSALAARPEAAPKERSYEAASSEWKTVTSEARRQPWLEQQPTATSYNSALAARPEAAPKERVDEAASSEWRTVTSGARRQPRLEKQPTTTSKNPYTPLRTGVSDSRQVARKPASPRPVRAHLAVTGHATTSPPAKTLRPSPRQSPQQLQGHGKPVWAEERTHSPSKPQVVINNKPDQRRTVPGNNTFAGAVKTGEKLALLSDSICNRMNKYELKRKLGCSLTKKAFPGATSDDLHNYYMWPTLNKNTPDVAIIHVGVNNILARGTNDGGATANVIEDIAKDIIKCGEACTSAGVNTVCISGVLPFKGRRAHATTNHINHQVAKLCMEHQYDFILHDNIRHDKNDPEALYYSDGLHLSDKGQDILIDNFKHYLDQRASK